MTKLILIILALTFASTTAADAKYRRHRHVQVAERWVPPVPRTRPEAARVNDPAESTFAIIKPIIETVEIRSAAFEAEPKLTAAMFGQVAAKILQDRAVRERPPEVDPTLKAMMLIIMGLGFGIIVAAVGVRIAEPMRLAIVRFLRARTVRRAYSQHRQFGGTRVLSVRDNVLLWKMPEI